MTAPPASPALIPELRVLALKGASMAGELLAEGQSEVRQVRAKSSAVDAVTQMDIASEQALVAFIRRHRPDDSILGEEGGEQVGSSPVRWVIDPLDGTVNYLYGLPAWAVSVGVELDGVTIAGAVVAPGLDEAFHAGSGHGAVLDRPEADDYGQRLHVRAPVPLELALLATGFGYRADRRAYQAQVIAGLLPKVRDIRRVGAAALDLCWLAAGRFDAYFERGLQPWDSCAGTLIAREAGAVVTGLGEPDPTPALAVGASSADLHQHLCAELDAARALAGP